MDFDPLVEHGADAGLQGRQVRPPPGQPLGRRLERLQADFHFLEIGLAQQPGRRRVDPLAPQFAGEGQRPPGVGPRQTAEKIQEIRPLVQRRIQQEDLGHLPRDRVAEVGRDLLGGEEPQRAAPLGIGAIAALEPAAADRLQRHDRLGAGIENAFEIRRRDGIQGGQRISPRGGRSAAGRPEAGNGRRLRGIAQRGEQLGEGLLAFAEDGVVDCCRIERPGVVGGDFRPAQQHLQLRLPPLELLDDPQRPLDIPKVTGEADHPRLPAEDFFHQTLVAQRVAQRRRQQLDGEAGLQALAAGEELQRGRRQRHIAADRLGPRRRNRQLHQQDRPAVGIHASSLPGGVSRCPAWTGVGVALVGGGRAR